MQALSARAKTAVAINALCTLAVIGGATLLALALLDFVAYTAFVLRFFR